MKLLLTSALILCLSTGTASAKCALGDGVKWAIGGAVAGTAVALVWGGL